MRLRPLAVLAALAVLTAMVSPAAATPDGTDGHGPKPTIVLVHGAFADAAGWNGVIERLERHGYEVIAPANPLRDLHTDAEYIGSVVASIPGPVVLVGHSYGGAVISNAAVGHPNVKSLVYIAGFAPEQGESTFELTGRFPGSLLPPNILPRQIPGGGTDAYINPAKFHEVFAADLPDRTARLMAATQRPITLAAGDGKSGEPAWKTVPSWYMVASDDKAIPAEAERFMAKRANAHTVEVKSSHVAMISHPDEVEALIRAAAR